MLIHYISNSVPSLVFYGLRSINFTMNVEHENSIFLLSDVEYINRLLIFCFLDSNCQFKIFSDLVVVDYPEKVKRFHLLYNILSVSYNTRIFFGLWCSELDSVKSTTDLFPSSNWFEREAWDLFGIHFDGNSDLRRILTDYGFYGHPFRKDFPLSGYSEIYYNSRLDTIIHQPISLVQEFRQFDTSSPWNWFQKDLT